MTLNAVWLLLTVLITAVVSAVEAAISKVSLSRLDEIDPDETKAYAALRRILEDRPRHVNALQALSAVGWTLTAILAQHYLEHVAGVASADTLAVVSVSLIGFIVYGVGARTLGKQHAETLAKRMTGPVRLLSTLLSPVVRLMILVGNAITPGKGFQEGPFASTAELRELVDLASHDVIEDDERRMIHSVFELGDTVARELMVPRTEMVWVERSKSLRQALSLSLRSGYSRIPVIGEDVDDVVGVIYTKDVARRIFEHSDAQQSERVESIMRPVIMEPDSKQVDVLLREMQLNRTHIIVLIDEYGGTAGLITLEDIIEEIVGEITDEYDTAAAEVVELDNGFRVSARLHIEDLAELIGVELDADEEGIDTVAGLLAARLGRVPIPGSTLSLDGWTITAESAAGRRNKVGSFLVEKPEVEHND